MLDFIKKLAQNTGEIICTDFAHPGFKPQHKGAIDLVTETDLKCEEYLIHHIGRAFPHDGIMTEERSIINPQSDRRWIIDPLDGTTNFSHRFPFFAVSICLEIEKVIRYGVVFAPILEELFEAELGKGARLNGKMIQVSTVENITNSLIATGFPYDRWQNADFYLKEYLAFLKKCQGIRRAGAASIDLCYVACGRLEGFFERKLHPWDVGAGSLIIRESGGKITNFTGENWDYDQETILASNSLIHSEMRKILSKAHN